VPACFLLNSNQTRVTRAENHPKPEFR